MTKDILVCAHVVAHLCAHTVTHMHMYAHNRLFAQPELCRERVTGWKGSVPSVMLGERKGTGRKLRAPVPHPTPRSVPWSLGRKRIKLEDAVKAPS